LRAEGYRLVYNGDGRVKTAKNARDVRFALSYQQSYVVVAARFHIGHGREVGKSVYNVVYDCQDSTSSVIFSLFSFLGVSL